MAEDDYPEPMSEADWQRYDAHVHEMRQIEYPMLADSIYLDHAGTTLYSKSLIEDFGKEMTTSLLGNPHSMSTASQVSGRLVEEVRFEALRLIGADSLTYDLVFVANATAAIKLVGECLAARDDGFWYGYHQDCHTSMVGLRQLASKGSQCLDDAGLTEELQSRSQTTHTKSELKLVGYTAQSNFNGRRLPLQKWDADNTLVLLDAASYVSTSFFDLSNKDTAPDLVALSFYKIFGFPDLGALVVKKSCGPLLKQRRYFGGGTVDMVAAVGEQWHALKSDSIHSGLEDGTLPIHSILALRCALSTHQRLYPNRQLSSQHPVRLSKLLSERMSQLRHGNGRTLCAIHTHAGSLHGDAQSQGPIIAFNLKASDGSWIGSTEIEKMAAVENISLRTGGLCNPGGLASTLGLSPWELRQNFSAGFKCSSEDDIVNGKPAGVARVSLGIMSTFSDVTRFCKVLEDYFVDEAVTPSAPEMATPQDMIEGQGLYVEQLMIYPVKSCAAWTVPLETSWNVRREGLEWDREWCIVHRDTGEALSQKRYPRMALLRPRMDMEQGRLHITDSLCNTVSIPLSPDPCLFVQGQDTTVCGEAVTAMRYACPGYADFLTRALGVPCQLARFPSGGTGASSRHCKAHLATRAPSSIPRPILLSNESPILVVSRASLDALNEQIKARGGRAVEAASFRPNLVVGHWAAAPPYTEDSWAVVEVAAGFRLEMLGACRRCQMVCVDQQTAAKTTEPFATLARTRRYGGKVWFGQHASLFVSGPSTKTTPSVKVGDTVRAVEWRAA